MSAALRPQVPIVRAKGLVEFFVIERAEKPSDN